MSERTRNEKGEKERDEGWDEKWRNDPVNAAVLALVLIWAGLVWLADNLNLFRVAGMDTWSIILVGAGFIVLLGVAVRLAVPAYRRPVVGSIILGLILLAIGLGDEFGWDIILPLVLIAIGIAGLLGYFRSRR